VEPLQIAERLRAEFQDAVLSVTEFRGQVAVTVDKHKLFEIARFLKQTPDLDFNMLRDLTAVDYLGKRDTRFEVVYGLYSLKLGHFLRLKAPVTEADCTIDTITPLWVGADWHERECFDLFGVVFKGHPDLRRILLPEDWTGHPLRKDYPVTGPSPEREWAGYKEVLQDSERLKEYEWNR